MVFPVGRVFGFPLFVDLTAVIVLAWYVLQGAQGGGASLARELLIGLGIFGSILAHELGHAWASRHYRLFPIEITLHGFGGLTAHAGVRTRWQGLVVTGLGPAASLLLGLVLTGVGMVLPDDRVLTRVIEILGFLNLFWFVFNLLPMYPLDGGSLLRYGLSYLMPSSSALVWAARVSVLVALGVGVLAWSSGQFIILLIVGLSLMRSIPLAMGDQAR